MGDGADGARVGTHAARATSVATGRGRGRAAVPPAGSPPPTRDPPASAVRSEASKRNALLLIATDDTGVRLGGRGWGGVGGAERRAVPRRADGRVFSPRRLQPPSLAGYLFATRTGSSLHVTRVAVAPSRRRLGVARALLSAAASPAKRGARPPLALTLHVDPANAGAVALYRAAGFADDGFLENYYSPGRAAARMLLTPAP